MKTYKTIGMMLIGMMMLGTTNVMAKNHNHGPRPVTNSQPVVVVVDNGHRHVHHGGMVSDMRHRPHRHVLSRHHHDCRICHIPLDRYGRPLPPNAVRNRHHIHR